MALEDRKKLLKIMRIKVLIIKEDPDQTANQELIQNLSKEEIDLTKRKLMVKATADPNQTVNQETVLNHLKKIKDNHSSSPPASETTNGS